LWLKVVIAKGRFLLARIILPAAAVALLGIQLVFGGEQGLWGVQPAELAKLLLVLMAGFVGMHLTELRRRNAKLYQRQPTRYILDFLKMLILVAFGLLIVLAGVRDISPILIIGILGLAWLWKVAPHPWKSTPAKWGNRGLVFLAAVVILILGFGARALPDGLPEWVPQRTRFQVWAQPERYPHSGMQVFQATAMAAQGSWLGAGESWFGENGNANTLPAVQNDFIVSFLLYRFGGLMGLLLMGVQLAYILLLFRLSRNLDNRVEKTQDWRLRQSGTTHGYIIFGLAWIHIAQWSISWGNALGVLPVMGQPMTWISAANSHMLFVGLPVLVLAMVSGWVVEDR
jgi:cell division protein FtsW (lipid II flippase)